MIMTPTGNETHYAIYGLLPGGMVLKVTPQELEDLLTRVARGLSTKDDATLLRHVFISLKVIQPIENIEIKEI
jgi:hypothetical protein